MRSSIDWNATANLFEEAATVVTAADYESRLQAFTLGPPRMDWSVPEAFLAILIAAAQADMEITTEERDQLKGLRTRSRILKSLSPDQAKRANETATKRLQERGETGLREACDCLPHVLRLPVFTLAIDLVLADGKLTQGEREFIGKLAVSLQIEPGVERQISQVMLIKNNC
jgi:hypothetical protein